MAGGGAVRRIINYQLSIGKEGQILVIMMLIMVVGMTIGLFLLGKTTTDVSLTSKISDSNRAFNAAEAGIEEALRSIGSVTGDPVPIASGISYTVNKSDLGGTNTIYPASIGDPVSLGDIFTIWLSPHNETTGDIDWALGEGSSYQGNIFNICFGNNTANYSSPNIPAISVTVYYQDASGKFQNAATGFDPDDDRRGNGFLDTEGGLAACADYEYRGQVNLVTTFGANLTGNGVWLIALRIKPLFTAVEMAVDPVGQSLPKQGNNVASVGTGTETTRKITVDNPYKIPAPFLDYVIYSKGTGGLTK